MTSSIYAFPTELIRMIVEHVPEQDLRQLRLASRKFYQETSEILFRRVYASPHKKDLRVLSAIANHTVLRLCPREIVYVGAFFDSRLPKRSIWDRLAVEKRQFYVDRLKEQEEMIKNGLDVDMITSALTKLPSIDKVIFSNHWCSESSNPPLMRDDPGCYLRPSGDIFADIDCENAPLYDHGLQVMCRAISISGLKLKELSMHYHCGSDFGYHDDDEPWNSGFHFESLPHDTGAIERACNTFRSMRKIELSLTWTYYLDLPDIWQDRCAGLAKILSAATELGELTLSFNQKPGVEVLYDGESSKLPLTPAILTTQPLPKLHTLRLRFKYMLPEELIALLKPLAGTLKTLDLHGIYLNGSWRATAMELHKIEWKQLEQASFVDLRECHGYLNGYNETPEIEFAHYRGVEACMRQGNPDLVYEITERADQEWPPPNPTDDYCDSWAALNLY